MRTFGEFIGHIADANFCVLRARAKRREAADVQPAPRSLTTKAELVAALAKAFAYCDEVYGGLTDDQGARHW